MNNFEAPFRVLFYESGMGISLVDLERRILDVNPAFEKMIGYSKAELVGKTFAGIMYPEDSPRNLELHHRLLAGELDIYHMERRYIRKNGEILWTRLTVSLLRDKNGKADLTMGIVEDISDQKRAEAKLLEQQEQLQQASKMSALGEMASGIAHEINNPLNVINFRAQHLRAMVEDGKLDGSQIPRVLEHALNIEKNVGRITGIVKGLQAFARKSDQDPFETVPVQFLLNEAIELSGERFKYKNIELKVAEVAGDLKVECRPTQVLQVLANLLNNAFDAVQELPERWVSIEVRDAGASAEILVTDSGHGISPAVADKMFEQFYTTKPAGKGTGLGLSISRTILESHFGELRIDKACPNTRFVVALPKNHPDLEIKRAPVALKAQG